MRIVETYIKELDQAALPSDDVRVMTLPAGMASDGVRQALANVFGPGAAPGKPEDDQEEQKKQNGENGQGGPNARNRARVNFDR